MHTYTHIKYIYKHVFKEKIKPMALNFSPSLIYQQSVGVIASTSTPDLCSDGDQVQALVLVRQAFHQVNDNL